MHNNSWFRAQVGQHSKFELTQNNVLLKSLILNEAKSAIAFVVQILRLFSIAQGVALPKNEYCTNPEIEATFKRQRYIGGLETFKIDTRP